jgi:hypothetical protein
MIQERLSAIWRFSLAAGIILVLLLLGVART